MAVPKPNIRWRGAHPNNFTVGRPGASRDGRNSFHHVVGSRESAVIVFNQPNRGASSHFVVGGDIIDQCVDINNTSWCDGNWESNLRTISVEHEGGWNGTGPYSNEMYEQAAHLCAWLRENYGVNRYVKHRDVTLKSTACPGGLDCDRIWNRATQIINSYNQPPAQPEWMQNRKPVAVKTMYAQNDGFFLRKLTNTGEAADSRRFARNQDFLIGGYTTVGNQKFWITQSSMSTNTPNGLLDGEVKDSRFTPPVPQPEPPKVPTTPEWASSLLKDEENRVMYVIRATPLVDLENGHPYIDPKTNQEKWFAAGEKIDNISAHTTIGNPAVTYQMTEYAFAKTKEGDWKGFGNGIKASDLSVDPKATPPGTPHNPLPPVEPEDPVEPMPDVPTPVPAPDMNAVIAFLQMLAKLITDFVSKLKPNK
jgi:hypothetical protein